MKKTTVTEVRENYLRFFESKGHVRIPSASLVPENDPTTLFTGSGMQPMVPYLLGQKHPLGKRVTNSQKSFRASDIEEVGDSRHTTFFEMLGNWSLGDYFKTEQIRWIFSFLVTELGLDPRRLYVTAFRGNSAIGIPRDEETVGLWQELFSSLGIEAKAIDTTERSGLQGSKIFYYDEAKNWWSRAGVPASMPVGEPGGPDSEVFWDFGAERRLHEQSPFRNQPCHVNCDCGRFLEIGNSVFMEYIKTDNGFDSLPQKNVDFGGGLERLTAAVNDEPDVFLIDVFEPLRKTIENLSGKTYGAKPEETKAFRVIMDHVRAAVFLIGDGVLPSNRDQGYFVRRLLRRAIRYSDQLVSMAGLLPKGAYSVIESYQQAYPELSRQQTAIIAALHEEEAKFRKTLSAGLKTFQQALKKLKDKKEIPASVVFNLYQSYGFPFEMTQELAQERGFTVSRESFDEARRGHQALSRSGAEQKFKGGLADHSTQSVHYHTATHLLHASLRTVLGEHVVQKGSNITQERLRFDFSYGAKMTSEEIAAVENLINEKIKANLPVVRQEMTVAEAKKVGALGLFEHKYGEKVNVYTIGNFSVEICGGPHVTSTGELGTFKITKEETVSAGVRRIKAVLV